MNTYCYNFNGNDFLLFPQEIISIVDQNNVDLIPFLIKDVLVSPKPTFIWNPYYVPKGSVWTKLTPPKRIISYLLVNNKNKYYCNEGAGTMCYDSSGNQQHAEINLCDPNYIPSSPIDENQEKYFHIDENPRTSGVLNNVSLEFNF